jgi:two-component system sensor histidine kinase HydH
MSKFFMRLKEILARSGVPPWVLIGAVAVLLPIFAFMTIQSVNREKEFATRLLLEKGAALIRAFEAGARTGMMGMPRGGFQLQHLLTETSRQSDIAHLIVTDAAGQVLAHSDPEQVGSGYAKELDLKSVSQSKNAEWRRVKDAEGGRIFEVFRRFEPAGQTRGMGMMRGPGGVMRRPPLPEGLELVPEPPRIIFVGLDMTAVEEARRSDVAHAVVMGAILLLAGFAGVTLLILTQSYRTARSTLSRVQAFSDHVVAHMPIGLTATDSGQRIAVFNQAAERLLGRSAGQAIGKPAEEVLPPELWRPIEKGAATGTVVGKEIDCALADGRMLALEVGVGRLADAGGRFLGSVLLFKDLAEIRALRGEVSRHQRLAAVGRLAAGVAHEIRNPLSSIKGFATYFRERYAGNPEDVQTATILIQEVDRLNRVVSQLLEFSRPVGIVPRPCRLAELIAASLRLVEGPLQEKNIEVRTECPAPEAEVRVDPDRLNQVLLNLYLNAVEAMAPGGLLRVAVEDGGSGGGFRIRVSDTGCGIRPEDLSQVFEPYFTTKPTGTGLGLAIAHNIVAAMGGRITVESRLGEGTRFEVNLPA